MKPVWIAVALLALGGLTLAQQPAAGSKPAQLPGDALWDDGTWADDYLVVAKVYDARAHQITWTLEARKKVTAQRYQAHFADPDLIELDTRTIQMTPVQKEYRKGSQIKAVLKLPPSDVMREVNRVKIDRIP